MSFKGMPDMPACPTGRPDDYHAVIVFPASEKKVGFERKMKTDMFSERTLRGAIYNRAAVAVTLTLCWRPDTFRDLERNRR
jgi:hypothetical protein